VKSGEEVEHAMEALRGIKHRRRAEDMMVRYSFFMCLSCCGVRF
jgi:hypothetical protein